MSSNSIKNKNQSLRFVDLFCGIGGFRLGFEQACSSFNKSSSCVFSSDIDPYCRKSYQINFLEEPFGDIKDVDATAIPDHDVLLAGFPCQPFSIIGSMKGLEDTRGTLFFDIARILKEKQPECFVLENVKQLVSHSGGRTFYRILQALRDLNYNVHHQVLNALDFGLPQKRERIFIVGFKKKVSFSFPKPINGYTPLAQLLENDVDKKYYASEEIRHKRNNNHISKNHPSIWHENKSGHISSYPYSCALRAGASYNYLLVNGERRLTPREMLRLQGFPDSYQIVVTDSQIRKQAGNAVPVNLAKAVLECLISALLKGDS